MATKPMQRAVRAARSLKGCEPVLAFLCSAPVRQRLVAAARRKGYAPVRSISADLEQKFGKTVDFKSPVVRQFIGIAARAVLDEAGFEVDERVKIVGDPIFRTGSTYRPFGGAETVDDVLTRFLLALNADERKRARKILDAALG